MFNFSYRSLLIAIGTLILILTLLYQYHKATLLKLEQQLEIYHSQFINLQHQSAENEKRFKLFQEQAEADMLQYQKKSDDIMKQNVPINCKQAVQWGLQQAKEFN